MIAYGESTQDLAVVRRLMAPELRAVRHAGRGGGLDVPPFASPRSFGCRGSQPGRKNGDENRKGFTLGFLEFRRYLNWNFYNILKMFWYCLN